MWTVVPVLYNAFTAPHIQNSIFIWTYLRCYCRYLENPMRVKMQTCCPIQRTTASLRSVNCGPGHILCKYSCVYSGFNTKLNVSPPLFEICRQFNGPYTANIMPNIAHILQFPPCELWCPIYTMYLQLRILRPQYSTERICAAIGNISTMLRALHCKLGAK
jgi:hypothetical protein